MASQSRFPQSVRNCTTRIPAHTRIALHHEVLIQSKMILTCVRTLNKLWAPANAVKGLKAQHRNEINGDCTLVHWYMDNTALVTRGPESCKKKHSNSQENLLRKRGLQEVIVHGLQNQKFCFLVGSYPRWEATFSIEMSFQGNCPVSSCICACDRL